MNLSWEVRSKEGMFTPTFEPFNFSETMSCDKRLTNEQNSVLRNKFRCLIKKDPQNNNVVQRDLLACV